MVGHQLITLSPLRLIKLARLHRVVSQPLPARPYRQSCSATKQRHQFGPAERISSSSYRFFSTPFSETATGDAGSSKDYSPRCPTCAAEIETNFNLTTQIEEKCKCSKCKAFLPTHMVINKGKDDQWISVENRQDIHKNQNENLIDYFKLFEVEKKFIGLDFLKLKKNYHLWQQIVHPDFSQYNNSSMHHPSSLNLKFMKDWSAQINRAKDILIGDLTRAEYLIKLHGNIKLSEETDSLEDVGLLMEIMEAREKLEAATSRKEVESIQFSNQQSIEQVLNGLDSKFQRLILDRNLVDNSELDQLKELIIKLRYLENIKNIISSNPL